MPVSSFQTTIFDYLRVVFHRWQWILAMIVLATISAWFWTEFMAPREYRSEMKVMVWSRDPIDRRLKRMVQTEPLKRVIDSIRNKLSVDRRLQNLACNLRFVLKDRFYRETAPEDVGAALRAELEAFQLERTYGVEPVGLLAHLPGGLSRPLGLEESHTLGLAEIPERLGMQALARMLCEDLDEPPDAPLADQVILEMVSDGEAERREETERRANVIPYLAALRRRYETSLGPGASLKEVHAAAVGEVRQRLLQERETPGAGGFSLTAQRELLKEFLAIERLLDLRLYNAVRDLYANPQDALPGWIGRLKRGLSVGLVQHNLLTLKYSALLYPRRSPFDRSENVITHVVVRVAHAMVEQEFYSTENQQFLRTKRAIQKNETELKRALDRVNEELYNLKELREIQLSFLRQYPQTSETRLRDPDKTLKPGWDDAFRGLPQHSVHIRRIDDLYGDIQEIDEEITTYTALIRSLERDIEDPEKQTRTIPRKEKVEKGDPPEVVALKRELTLKLVELRQMREKNTDRHPFVVKLRGKIDQLRTALRDYQRQSHEPGEEEERPLEVENPFLSKWKEEKRIAERKLEQLQAQRKMKLALIDEEKEKAEAAIKKQREYQSLLDRHARLRKKLSDSQARREELLARQEIGEVFQVVFTVHTKSRPPARHVEPKENLILFMALLVGVLAAGTVVFLLEYTDHSIKTTEDVKRHIGLPVLGTIPEFSFSAIERIQRASERSVLVGGHRPRYPYPMPLDEAAPEAVSHRAKVTARRPQTPLLLLLLVLGLLALALLWLAPWGRLADWIRARTAGEPRAEAPAEGPPPEAGEEEAPTDEAGEATDEDGSRPTPAAEETAEEAE